MESEYSIEADSLTRRYGKAIAIENVSFNVRRGEIVGFLGPNGAGKSTTMRILCGLIPADSGSARICGQSVSLNPREVKRRIGYMPENNPLPADMRVNEYLRLRARLKEVPGRLIKSRIEEALEACDLRRKSSRRMIGALSKGLRQRVGIADALLSNPPVTIMDEPAIGLDPHQVILMRQLIANLKDRTTVVISSHILSEIEVSCDRVIIINQGRIVAAGSPGKLRSEFIDRSAYRLVADADPQALQLQLKEAAPDLKIEEAKGPDAEGLRELRLSTQEESDLSEAILDAARDRLKARVRAITRETASLEDIFLAATRRSWTEEAESVGANGNGKSAEPHGGEAEEPQESAQP